jgi:hypothetical protein
LIMVVHFSCILETHGWTLTNASCPNWIFICFLTSEEIIPYAFALSGSSLWLFCDWK